MSTTVSYKGSTIATVNNNTKTLKTAGKYMEGDVTLVDVSAASPTIQSLNITPSNVQQTFNAVGVDGYKPVTVAAAAVGSKNITANGTYNASGEDLLGYSSVTVGVEDSTFIVTLSYNDQTEMWEPDCTWAELSSAVSNHKTIVCEINNNDGDYYVATGSGFYGDNLYYSVYSNYWGHWWTYIFDDTGVTPDGDYEVVAPYLQTITKSYTPTESIQTETITFDSSQDYNGLQQVNVTVAPIPIDYVGSGIDVRDSTDLTASGATITVPAGYYENQATKSVAGGSATGPSSLSASSATITTGTNTITLTKTGVTTTPTVSAGYVSSATASTATVALTASVTVNPTPTASGKTVTIPAGYYSAQTTKDVSTGSATGPSTVSSTGASVSTGNNTLTLTKNSVSITPTVSAGYVSSGTASSSTVSLTASVTTKGATTYTPGTQDQTIASGTYLTGAQTISGDVDLVANNIRSGVQIFGVNGSLVTQAFYTGSSAPSSSLGSNGDIYLQQTGA